MKVALTTTNGTVQETPAYSSPYQENGEVYVCPSQALRQLGIPRGSIGGIMKRAIAAGVIKESEVRTHDELIAAGAPVPNQYAKYVPYDALVRLLRVERVKAEVRGVELQGARILDATIPDDAAEIVFPNGFPPERAGELRAELAQRLANATGIKVQLTDFQDDVRTDVTLEKDAQGLMPRNSDIEHALGIKTGKLSSIIRNAYINGVLIHGHHVQFVGPNENFFRLTPAGFKAVMKLRVTKRALGVNEARLTLI